MSKKMKMPHPQDIFWAYEMVAKDVKAVSIINCDLNCINGEVNTCLDSIMKTTMPFDLCYLDTIREPSLCGQKYGGSLLRPIIRAVPNKTATATHIVIFAATGTMADLFLARSKPNIQTRRYSALMLLSGFSVAIAL